MNWKKMIIDLEREVKPKGAYCLDTVHIWVKVSLRNLMQN